MTNRCNEIVETDCGPRRCGQRAWRDGFCKQHHPSRLKLMPTEGATSTARLDINKKEEMT